MAPTPSPIPIPSAWGCPLCEIPYSPNWRSQDNDRHCGLCGERILHLSVLFPAVSQSPLLLYVPPDGDLLLKVTWVQGLASKGGKRRLRPRLDLVRSVACFTAPTSLTWSLTCKK